MASFLEDLAIEALQLFAGHDEANEFLINRLVNRGRNRPHPWSTKNDYISWTGLTDRGLQFARLLREKPYPSTEALGTRRPPLAEVKKLFQTASHRPARLPQIDDAVSGLCPVSDRWFPAHANG